ncbi:MAG: GNAT family N-acetyltransferase [Gemmatimonadetes bacterium]|nr:GNAT family N-acetyltransferase [Gemmatimonadota bacterium]
MASGVEIRQYRDSDRENVRRFAATDEHERPEYLKKYPRLGDFRADGLAHYYDLEPESFFVAECCGEFVGNLLGAVDSIVSEQREETYTRRLRRRRLLSGAYGLPIWLVPLIRTDRARPITAPPTVDLRRYPAHLHIGVKSGWRRKGVGTSLMTIFEDYLRTKNVPGYHICASSYHHEGVSFYRKLGLCEIGDFARRFHDGFQWKQVTEFVFVRKL